MLKRIFLITVLFMAVAQAPTLAWAQDALRIVAVVNEDIISVFDLNARIRLFMTSSGMPDNPQTAQRLAPRIIQTLIEEKLKKQEAARLNITLDPREISAAVSRIEQQNRLSPGGMGDFLRSKGVPKQTFLDQIETELVWIRVVNSTLRPTVKVGADEVAEAMETIKNSKGKPEYWLFELFLPVDDSTATNDAVLFADRLISEIQGGGSFQKLAQTFSGAPSAEANGDLGWVRPDQLDVELRHVLSGMKPGDISRPFPSLGGYHILFLKDQRTAEGLVADEGAVELEQVFLPLSANVNNVEVSRQIEAARALTASANDCTSLHEAGLKSGSPLSGSLGRIQIGSLPSAIANVVRTLPDKTSSTPIHVEGGVAVLMICARDSESTGLESIRQKISSQILNRKLSAAADKLLRTLRRTAFLDIRI